MAARNKTKVEFEIIYEDNILKDISKFMSVMDLGISDISNPKKCVLQFTTTTKVNKSYIDKMKQTITKAFEADNKIVMSINKTNDGSTKEK